MRVSVCRRQSRLPLHLTGLAVEEHEGGEGEPGDDDGPVEDGVVATGERFDEVGGAGLEVGDDPEEEEGGPDPVGFEDDGSENGDEAHDGPPFEG